MTETGSVAEMSTENATRSVYSKSIVRNDDYTIQPENIITAEMSVPMIA